MGFRDDVGVFEVFFGIMSEFDDFFVDGFESFGEFVDHCGCLL